MKKVVFICNGNILRSQIAKALYNKLVKDGSMAESYGTRVEAKGRQGVLISYAKGMNVTIDELLKQGIDISSEHCNELKEEYLRNVDKIVVMTDREHIPDWLNNYKYEHWRIIIPDYIDNKIANDIIENIKEKVLELIIE
jgi:protein-tyrosine-phosphatase